MALDAAEAAAHSNDNPVYLLMATETRDANQ